MAKTTNSFQSSNPAFTGSGVAGHDNNHSSTELSTDHMVEAEHAQSDDAVNDYPPKIDPNISGRTVTEDTVSWLAGGMTGWRDNDDYTRFFMCTETPDSALVKYSPMPWDSDRDGDYDDNGGIPLAHGHYLGHVDAVYEHPQDNQVPGLNATIIRRF